MLNKPATIKDIARQLKISVSTVSRALHDHPSIGLRTRQRVQALAQQMHYEPNQHAISFQKGKTRAIGVILPRLSEEFFSQAISGIENAAMHLKYNVLIGQSYDQMAREKQIVETMKASRVDGLLVSMAKNTDSLQHFEMLKRSGIPVVFFDCVPDAEGVNTVSCDLRQGTLEGIDFLVRKGHSRIALLNGPKLLPASKQRQHFYLQGLKKHGIAKEESLIVTTDLSKISTQRALQQLLSLRKKPTAVIVFNDYVMLEAMQYLRSLKRPPQMPPVFISFAHLPFCNYLEKPPLASVEQFPYEQGLQAMEMLHGIMEGQETAAPQQIILKSKLVTW